jgi:hypothetical protein
MLTNWKYKISLAGTDSMATEVQINLNIMNRLTTLPSLIKIKYTAALIK